MLKICEFRESLRKSAAELKRQVREIELMKRQSLESNIKKTAFQKKLRCFRDVSFHTL